LSSFDDALTVEAANPIVKATAKTIANFFMILILRIYVFNCWTKLYIFRLTSKSVNNYLE
jgi:hypothetical protein